jgi:hypothetical protein
VPGTPSDIQLPRADLGRFRASENGIIRK